MYTQTDRQTDRERDRWTRQSSGMRRERWLIS